MSDTWSAFLFGLFTGIIAGGSIATGANEIDSSQQFNRGLATAVACSPGTYLEDSSGGMVYCIGGEGETWRVRP